MQRSEDHGWLGRLSSKTPLTRRERRILSTADAPITAPPEPDQRQASDFSLNALFSTANDVPMPEGEGSPTILTVCTGNICRSPLAEVLLSTRLADLDVVVRSAGTHALVGRGMPTPSKELAARHGVPSDLIDGHSATALTEQLTARADLVLTMAAEHTSFTLDLAPHRLHRTFTLREFARLSSSLTDKQLTAAARDATSPRGRLAAVVSLISNQRGVAPRASDSEDVIDPYHRAQSVYEQSAAEMLPALECVERVVRSSVAG